MNPESVQNGRGLRTLYPVISAFRETHIDVSAGHRIYLEESGHPDGLPVLFLHGGPGSGCEAQHRCYFDPNVYRIVLFDQRGSGRSTPVASLEQNDTSALLEDIEHIRRALGVEKWLLYGGSWGATLALLYAESCPRQVSGMILRGTFLARAADLHWFFGGGTRGIFPDRWQAFLDFFASDLQDDPAAMADTLYRALCQASPEHQQAAARAWAEWAGAVVVGPQYTVDMSELPRQVLAARIEMHYAVHRYFIEENQILQGLSRLPEVPVHLIHGRADLTCLPESSWTLHRALPGSVLEFVDGAGHLAGEPRMIDALVRATDAMALRLSGA